MTRLPLPGPDLLAAAPHLAALAALDAALRLTADALRAIYAEVERPFEHRESPEITTARILVDESDTLIAMLADHRFHLRARLHVDRIDWPF